jgi:diguanylate cyclase (GGDEF)-like protein
MACVGNLAGRNAGRPMIVLGQVFGLCAPLAITLLFKYSAWYWGLATILLLVLTSVRSTTRFLNGMLVSALLNGREARIQRTRFSTALDSMSHGLCMGDRDGAITVINQRLMDFFRIDAAKGELTAQRLAELIADSGGLRTKAKRAFLDAWDSHVSRRDSSVFSASIGEGIFDFRCEPEGHGGFVVVVSDVTAERLATREIERMAHFDPLTGLPNRSQFHDRLQAAVEQPSIAGEQLALLSIDLDQFKEVNDTRGHATGDELLRMVAKRLRRSLKSADLVARFGGDEFQALLRVGPDYDGVDKVARRVIEDLSQTFSIDGQLITIGASIGVAYAPRDATTADELLRCADMALYSAKAAGRGVARAFAPEMETALRRKREVSEHLRYALDHDGIEVHYQPVVDVRTGRIVACEALARLPHPTEGMISPGEFVPVAEDSGLIVRLGDHVLKRACMDAVDWPEEMRVAVNFSPKQFVLGRNIAEDISAALAATGLPPHRLEVEITESTILEAKDSLQQLREISAAGVKISLDDFGTGYSSLSYLRQFPVNKIKIDRSFALDIVSLASQAVIRSVSVLAELLDVELVIEGIETKAQIEVLKSWNIHLVQGYYFSRPHPLALILPMLASNNAYGRTRLRDVA